MKQKLILLIFSVFIFQTLVYTHTRIGNEIRQQDSRSKFFDLSKVKNRKPRSPIIQFYSSVDNIGNYLPILGIQKMLGQTPDTWCMHSSVDFDFVNKHYKCAIIGGAGLLHKCFEPFWKKLLNECKIPMIMWGLGICLPDKNKRGVDKTIVSTVVQRCSLINIRDELTAHYYNLKNASITACPTIVYLQDFYEHKKQTNDALYSFHSQLVSVTEHRAIKAVLQETLLNLITTNNIQTKSYGLEQIIKNYYCLSNLVITTRLHGAIIAYGLGIPYIIIARDEKLRSFHKKYKNGLIVESIKELRSILKNQPEIIMQPIEYEPVLEFGRQAREWVQAQIST